MNIQTSYRAEEINEFLNIIKNMNFLYFSIVSYLKIIRFLYSWLCEYDEAIFSNQAKYLCKMSQVI